MSNLSDIKRRLVSVKQTRQITGAMETVSIAKMRKANERLQGNKQYTQLLCGMASELARTEFATGNPFFCPNGDKKILLVVTSDKGLCGGFNHEIFKKAHSYASPETVIFPIGIMGGEFYRNKKNTDMRFATSYVPDYANAKSVADALTREYVQGAGELSVVYSVPSGSNVTPCVERILPIEHDGKGVAVEPEPSASTVCDILIPLYVTGLVYRAFLSNSAAEHCARRGAMMSATESADKLIAELSTAYNRARQSTVTEQIIEIIGATSALTEQGDHSEKRA